MYLKTKSILSTYREKTCTRHRVFRFHDAKIVTKLHLRTTELSQVQKSPLFLKSMLRKMHK